MTPFLLYTFLPTSLVGSPFRSSTFGGRKDLQDVILTLHLSTILQTLWVLHSPYNQVTS